MGYAYYPYEEMRSLYDLLCQIYTPAANIYDAFEITYEILSDLTSDDAQEYINRLIEARNSINNNCNVMLELMREIERITYGYDFFTKKMPNF